MDFPLIWAASEAGSSWISHAPTVIWNVLLVLIGVNLLIIVHEFGHFIVARMCGVRCEKFYIWFDFYGWKIFKFKWGDTEYGLGVLPLGGYVKMLGQEDNPNAIKAEIERAKQASDLGHQASGEGGESESAPVPTAEQVAQMEKSLYAKDSYLSKSVPQRLAIITAGVIMNFIFAFVCAVGAYMHGVPEMPSIVGNAVPGSNAWVAGLQPGDQITAIDGRPIRRFEEIRQAILRTSKPESDFVIMRPGIEQPIEMRIAPTKKGNALVAAVGVAPPPGLVLADDMPFYPWLEKTDEMKKLSGKETLIAIDGEAVTNFFEAQELLLQAWDKPLTYTFRKHKSDETVDVTLPPIAMATLRIPFKAGEITTVREHGKQFGFEENDLLVTLDGESVDPMKLPLQIYEKSQNGGGVVEIVVNRNGENRTLAIDVPAGQNDPNLDLSSLAAHMGSDILGIAYTVSAETVAEFEGVPAGATLEKITVLGEIPKSLLKSDFGKEVKNGYEIPQSDSLPNYVIFLYSRVFPRLKENTKVQLTFKSGQTIIEKEVTLVRDEQWVMVDRGLAFDILTSQKQAESFGQALQLGGQRMINDSMLIYHTVCQLLRNLNGTSRVSMKGLGGPIMIVQQAYHVAGAGLGIYLLFLCLLSANLAVLNILPIPVLDGGHVVFLLYEAIFRKPPNETVQVILSYMGLLLLLALMVWVFALDLGFIKRF